MTGLEIIFFVMAQASPEVTTPSVTEDVEKQVIYQKKTNLDFTGSKVVGEKQIPPTFFVTKMKTPNGESLLAERLKFKMKDFNELGF